MRRDLDDCAAAASCRNGAARTCRREALGADTPLLASDDERSRSPKSAPPVRMSTVTGAAAHADQFARRGPQRTARLYEWEWLTRSLVRLRAAGSCWPILRTRSTGSIGGPLEG